MSAARNILFSAVFIITAVFLLVPPNARSVEAAISSCSASVNVSSITTSTQANFSFTVWNTDANPVRWIKITRPSDKFTMGGYSIQGWATATSTEAYTLTGGTLAAGVATDLLIQVTSGSNEAPSADWNVQVSDDAGGASPYNCTGNLATEISGNPVDSTSPEISDIIISGVTSSAVTLSWTTNEDSSSLIDYGLTEDYDGQVSNSMYTSSHNLTVNDLSANTTYHFSITSDDASGNSAQTGDYTFVTAAAGSSGTTQTITVTTSTTTTNIVLVTPTPTATPTPDLKPPSVTIEPLARAYKKSPGIKGKAVDNVGVVAVEYSVDAGKNWLQADTVGTPGTKSLPFTFTPDTPEDGTYPISVKAVDVKGNTGYSEILHLVIDRLPPQVVGTLINVGPSILFPGLDGKIEIPAGLPVQLHLSAIGGPVTIQVSLENSKISLTKIADTNIWQATILLKNPGDHPLEAISKDTVDQETHQTIGAVRVKEPGSVKDQNNFLEGARIKVMTLNHDTKQYQLFNGSAFAQKNPLFTNSVGSYSLVVPRGTYFIEISHKTYQTVKTDIFSVAGPAIITDTFILEKKRTVKIGPLTLTLPDFRQKSHAISLLDMSPVPGESIFQINKPVPSFSLQSGDASLTNFISWGKPTVYVFVSPWSPVTHDILKNISSIDPRNELNIIVILPHTRQSLADIYQKRGDYSVRLYGDPDGVLVQAFSLSNLPTYIFADRAGTIRVRKFGVVAGDDLVTTLENL